jgi:hypothetical protein
VITFHPSEMERLLDTREISVIDIRPSRLTVHMEDHLERVIPVHVPMTGTTREGFRHVPGALRVVPAEVKVGGPRSEIQKLQRLETSPVRLDGLDHSAEFEQQVLHPDGRHLEVDPRTVRVQVTVEEDLYRKTLSKVTVQLKGCPEGVKCTVFPGAVRAVVHGPKRAMDQLKDPPAPGFVFATLPPGSGSAVHRLEVKTGYRLPGVYVQVEPAIVMVEVVAPNAASSIVP